jgi:integrase
MRRQHSFHGSRWTLIQTSEHQQHMKMLYYSRMPYHEHDLALGCTAGISRCPPQDAAIIALLRGTGLRRAEAVALDLADDHPTSTLTMRSDKGRKERLVYAPAGTKVALDEWLVIRGHADGPLFYGLLKGGALVVRRLRRSIENAARRFDRRSGDDQ